MRNKIITIYIINNIIFGSRAGDQDAQAIVQSIRRRAHQLPISHRGARRRPANLTLLDLSRAPYVLYGVKYIGLVSLDATRPANLKF